MKNYYNGFVKQAIKSREHLVQFLKSTDIKAKFSEEERKGLLELWDNESAVVKAVGPADDEPISMPPVDQMSKEELEIYARDKFNKELDRRHSHGSLLNQVKLLLTSTKINK